MLTTDLRIFLSVHTAGSLSAAARQLDLAPMQISRRVAALEQEMGVRLFHRTTRSVSLTTEGEAFLPYARQITDAEDGAHMELRPSAIRVMGVLRMTAPSVFGQSIVLPLISDLLQLYPELRVDLDLSDKVVDIVGSGLDLALRVAPLADSELVARKMAENPRVLCAAPRYLEQYGVPKTCTELHSHHCIVLQSVPRWPLMINGELQRLRMPWHISTSSVDAVRTAALLGMGMAMLTYWDVVQQLKDGSLVQVQLSDATMEDLSVWAVTSTRRFQPARVKVFLDALQTRLAGVTLT